MGTLTINNAACNVVIYRPEYGLLYNWYTTQGTGTGSLTSSDDWVVPTHLQWRDLMLYIDPDGTTTVNTAGDDIKEVGTTHWVDGNTGTNSVGMNIRGAGYRNGSTGSFQSPYVPTSTSYLLASTDYAGVNSWYARISHDNDVIYIVPISDGDKFGMSCRLLYTGAGTPTSYTGNDGKIYRVVTIGTQTWLADNLAETRFRNGDIIPWYGADSANFFTNTEWAALTTAGCCAYDNDTNNVAPGFSFPT